MEAFALSGLVTRLLAPRNLDVSTSAELAELLRRGGGPSASGVDVSAASANTVSSWFGANRNVAEDIGKLPFILYKQGDDRQRATDSPHWRLIHDQAAPRWSSQKFREYMTFWALQDGDSFALKNRNGSIVRELLPFKRGWCVPEETDDGELVYRIQGETEPLAARHIFHMQGFAMNFSGGAALLKLSREDIGLSLAMERHGATFFGNGAHPGGVATHPGTLTDPAYERLRTSIKEEYSQSGSHSPLLLEEGLGWQEFSNDNTKSQFLEGRKFQVTESSRRVRIPPHKISDLERATFSNIEHSSIEYVVDTLLPWALRWETAVNQQVLGGTKSVYAELLFDMLLRGDSETRATVYAQAIQNGWMTPNEARRRENLPPVPGGDELYTPLNLATPRDRELAQLNIQSTAAGRFVRAGWDPADALETCGLPPMEYVGIPKAGGGTEVEAQERALETADA